MSCLVFFFKQKTAYELRISDWSSDVCSSDLWLARTPSFAPIEYSKLGLEHFTPDYTRYFHALPEPVRDKLVPAQWQLHKGIDTDKIGRATGRERECQNV